MEVVQRLLGNMIDQLQRTMQDGPNLERIDALTVSAERLLVMLLAICDSTVMEGNVAAMQVVVENLNQISSLPDGLNHMVIKHLYHLVVPGGDRRST